MWIQQANVLLGILLAGSVAAQDWPYSCLAATNASEIIDGIDASGKVVVITGGGNKINCFPAFFKTYFMIRYEPIASLS